MATHPQLVIHIHLEKWRGLSEQLPDGFSLYHDEDEGMWVVRYILWKDAFIMTHSIVARFATFPPPSIGQITREITKWRLSQV